MKKQTLIGIALTLLLGLTLWQPQRLAAAKAAVAPPSLVNGWEQKFPATPPPGRVLHTMVRIGGDQVLFFGGLDGSSYHNDTWVYDLSDNTWTQKFPTTSPSVRFAQAMAYIGDDKVLLFGGFTGAPYANDTWVYDLSDNTWTNKSPASPPSVREYSSLAYLGGTKALLFGGTGFGTFGDTWVYDLSNNTWTNKGPAISPSARLQQAMAYLGGDQVMLFGGNYPGGPGNDTWVYDLSDNNWTLKSPATKPSARASHSLAALDDGRILLFGGGFSGSDETWLYRPSDNTWTQRFPATKPSARHAYGLASLGGDQVLLFGGQLISNGSVNGETWVFDIIPELSINDVSVNEGTGGTTTFDFTVSLSEPAGVGGVTFEIATQEDSATTANNDYASKSLTPTIPEGMSTYTFSVTVNGDVDYEADETFFVNVSNVTGATLADVQGSGTILNDDCPTITATVSGGGAICPGGSSTVTVTLLGGSAPYSVTLSNGVTMTGSSPLVFTVSPASTTTYTVQSASSASGCPVTPSGSAIVTTDEIAPQLTLKPAISLWSPNHKYLTVTMGEMVQSVSDNCTTLSVDNVVIEKVTSDEADNAPGDGDGNTTQDIVIAAGCKSVQLRSERNDSGNGRVYNVTLRVRDATGNPASAVFKVTVPKNQSGATVVDSGIAFTVNSGCP